MTTTVSLTTHSRPVRVTTTDKLADGTLHSTDTEVAPNSTHVAHLTSTRALSFEELPIPTPAEDPAPVTDNG